MSVSPVMFLPQTNLQPRNGWKARQPETGSIVIGYTWPHLLEQVDAYRTANDLPLEPNFERQVHNQVCQTLDPEERAIRCRFDGDGGAVPRHLRPWRTTGKTLKNWAIAAKETIKAKLRGKSFYVAKETIEGRALTCSSCPENLPIANCFGCGEVGQAFTSLLNESPPLPRMQLARLETCDVCGCPNHVQVYYPDDLLELIREKQGIPPTAYPNWCWKAPENKSGSPTA